MSEQIRNQHKNSMKNRPLGQSAMDQFVNKSAHMDGTYMGDEITEEEYNA